MVWYEQQRQRGSRDLICRTHFPTLSLSQATLSVTLAWANCALYVCANPTSLGCYDSFPLSNPSCCTSLRNGKYNRCAGVVCAARPPSSSFYLFLYRVRLKRYVSLLYHSSLYEPLNFFRRRSSFRSLLSIQGTPARCAIFFSFFLLASLTTRTCFIPLLRKGNHLEALKKVFLYFFAVLQNLFNFFQLAFTLQLLFINESREEGENLGNSLGIFHFVSLFLTRCGSTAAAGKLFLKLLRAALRPRPDRRRLLTSQVEASRCHPMIIDICH